MEVATAWDDATLKKLFWLGANCHRPVDLPDTTGLSWREAVYRCLGSVQARTSPPSLAAPASPPLFAAPSRPPFTGKSAPPFAAKASPPAVPLASHMNRRRACHRNCRRFMWQACQSRLLPGQCQRLDSALQSPLLDSALQSPCFQSAPKSLLLQSAPKCPIEPLLSPRNFFLGGGGLQPERPGRGRGPRPRRRSRHGLLNPPIRHGHPSPLTRHGIQSPLTCHGHLCSPVRRWSRNGRHPGGLLSCPVSVSLEASRAPTPPPRWMLLRHGTRLPGGGSSVRLVFPCLVSPSLLCPYLVFPVLPIQLI